MDDPARNGAETCDFDLIERHSYGSHRGIDPTGTVPIGPELDSGAPHDRGPVRLAA